MQKINSETLYELQRQDVIKEATETGTLSMMDASDIHIATMNRCYVAGLPA